MNKRERFPWFYFMMAGLATACSIFLVSDCVGKGRTQVKRVEDSLKRFLRDYVAGLDAGGGKTTEYFAAFAGLTDDGAKEVIVYQTNDGWCGTGGCTTLILAPKNHSYRVVSKVMITRPPIRMLATKSHGWHDIAVRVQGGGIQSGYEAKLSFNGKSYPVSPSSPRARLLVEKVAGEVVVPTTAVGNPLY